MWVDDISIDFASDKAAQASREVLQGYELPREKLEGAGL